MSNEMNIRDRLTLAEVSTLVDSVVGVVFVESDGQIDYGPENLKAARDFFMIAFYAPDVLDGTVGISDFYEEVQNGTHYDILKRISENSQVMEIDNYIEQKIQYRLAQTQNAMSNAVSSLLNTVTSVVKSLDNKINGLDMNEFIEIATKLGDKFDLQSALTAIVDKNVAEKAEREISAVETENETPQIKTKKKSISSKGSKAMKLKTDEVKE